MSSSLPQGFRLKPDYVARPSLIPEEEEPSQTITKRFSTRSDSPQDRMTHNPLPRFSKQTNDDVLSFQLQNITPTPENYNGAGSKLSIGDMEQESGSQQIIETHTTIPQTSFDVQGGQPLQLIKFDPKTGKFNINEEAIEEMSKYDGNIGIVTAVGKHKSGKSSLLNKILNLKNKGFPTDSNTQGIWIWSKPIYREEENLYIFFLDTEGSHNIEKSAAYDTKMLALSLLLSSYMIYHSNGVVDETTITDMFLFTQLTKHVTINPNQAGADALHYFMPRVLWTLRDFEIFPQEGESEITCGNNYIESVLRDKSIINKTSATNKIIRKALLSYLHDRDCVALGKPVKEERDLHSLENLDKKKFRPGFLKQLNLVRDRILNKTEAIQLKGTNLTTRMFIATIVNYIQTLNDGETLDVTSAWEYMIDSECREAFEDATTLYEVALKRFFHEEEKAKAIDELYDIMKNMRDLTLEKFYKATIAFESHRLVTEYKKELKDYLNNKEQGIITVNETINQENNRTMLEKNSVPLKKNISSGIYGIHNIQSYSYEFDKLVDNYEAEGQGLTKTSEFISFVKALQTDIINTLASTLDKTQEEQMRTESENTKRRFAESEKLIKENMEILKENEYKTREEAKIFKQEKIELYDRASEINAELEKLKKEEVALLEERRKNEMALKKVQDQETALLQNIQEVEESLKKKKSKCNIF